jgi:hypothetical protein
MQARLAKYRGPIENGTQTPLGKSFCLGREIAVTLQRAGITRVEPLDGNGWMVLLRLFEEHAAVRQGRSRKYLSPSFGERIGAAYGWDTSTRGMARMSEECGVPSTMNSEVDAASRLHRLIVALLGWNSAIIWRCELGCHEAF